MAVKQDDLFTASAPAPAFAWRFRAPDDKAGTLWEGTAAGGASARIWISGLSGKLVCTVRDPERTLWSYGGRVESVDDGKARAEEWLREARHG